MGTQQLGIYSVWLNRIESQNNTNITPNAIIDSLYELPNLLNNLNQKEQE